MVESAGYFAIKLLVGVLDLSVTSGWKAKLKRLSRKVPNITYDFSKFSPIDYLNEYYTEIYNGNEYLLQCLHGFFEEFGGSIDHYLEIGGGPTICQLISASSKAKSIVFAEYLEANRREVIKWINDEDSAFNWDAFFRFVLNLEQQTNPSITLNDLKERVRRKVSKIIRCDVNQENPISPLNVKFDVAASNFCLESITNNKLSFVNSLRNTSSLLKRDGILIMALIKSAKYYSVGKLNFPALSLDEHRIKSYLEFVDYTDIKAVSVPAEEGHGYDGMIFLSAKKGN